MTVVIFTIYKIIFQQLSCLISSVQLNQQDLVLINNIRLNSPFTPCKRQILIGPFENNVRVHSTTCSSSRRVHDFVVLYHHLLDVV